MDNSRIVDQVHIAALAYGTYEIAQELGMPCHRLLEDLQERSNSGLNLRTAMRIIDICIRDGPDQARVAAHNAIDAIAQMRGLR